MNDPSASTRVRQIGLRVDEDCPDQPPSLIERISSNARIINRQLNRMSRTSVSNGFSGYDCGIICWLNVRCERFGKW